MTDAGSGRLFAVEGVVNHGGDLVESGFMEGGELSAAREASRGLLKQLRPDALALVEAFGERVQPSTATTRFVMTRLECDWQTESPSR